MEGGLSGGVWGWGQGGNAKGGGLIGEIKKEDGEQDVSFIWGRSTYVSHLAK